MKKSIMSGLVPGNNNNDNNNVRRSRCNDAKDGVNGQ